MIFGVIATVCSGLFAGAAIYVSAVEHPARLSCGTALALREFAPSYRRGTVMQASLAVVGLAASGCATVCAQGPPALGPVPATPTPSSAPSAPGGRTPKRASLTR